MAIHSTGQAQAALWVLIMLASSRTGASPLASPARHRVSRIREGIVAESTLDQIDEKASETNWGELESMWFITANEEFTRQGLEPPSFSHG